MRGVERGGLCTKREKERGSDTIGGPERERKGREIQYVGYLRETGEGESGE